MTIISIIVDLYYAHIQMMESQGFDTGKDAPLFVNRQGNPMTVQIYSGRIKRIFCDYCLQVLKLSCDKQNTSAEMQNYLK